MVKTRHSGDYEDDSPRLLSLEKRHLKLNVDEDDEESNRHRAYNDGKHAFNVLDDSSTMESRLRPRGPNRVFNYLDDDFSDEDIRKRSRHQRTRVLTPPRQLSRSFRSRRIKQEMLDEMDRLPRRKESRDSKSDSSEPEDDNNSKIKRSPRRRRGSPGKFGKPVREQEMSEESSEDLEVQLSPQHHRKSLRRPKDITDGRAAFDNKREQAKIEEDGAENVRRSSRTRRQIYDKLNQDFILSKNTRRMKEKNEEDGNSEDNDNDEDTEQDGPPQYSDMYSRVKRKRVQVKRNMYGVPVENSDSENDMEDANKNNNKNEEGDDSEEEDENDDEEDGDGTISGRVTRRTRSTRRTRKAPETRVVKAYSLREHKPRTDWYKAPVEERRIKRTENSVFVTTPTKKGPSTTYQSPAQRRNVRRRRAFHSSSSSTSSSDSESSDEKKFKKRKAKSMAKARSRMMPMNFSTNAVASASVIKDRVKSGASLADVEPMTIDKNVTFSSIGGLGKHIRALKEMVVFPLLYGKVFQKFKVDPPRGVLFYGPPGTGKTLVARALANECSSGDRRVAFFMRKGADCLSKWVGESERQLRLLFDQAYKFRPSIIFFDEIDGLAPVRSSRQDQIHSSIVSTLLALMDGLDSRGEIVVIGATNRIDSLDPALRRPGRFDREFLFPLPTLEARKQILKIHTDSWNPKLNDQFLAELAEKCVGYCGADLKALCTETAMLALRRRYPQIYLTNEALDLDVSSIQVSAKDFFNATRNIIPTSQRAVNTPARALPAHVCPLLQNQLDSIMIQLLDIFPSSLAKASSLEAAATLDQAQALAENGQLEWEDFASDDDEEAPSIFMTSGAINKGSKSLKLHQAHGANSSQDDTTHFLNFTRYAINDPVSFRPRLMLVGMEGQGQTTYMAPAVIHKMESLPVHVLDLPALYAVTAKTPEESCANVFHEAKRKCPSIIYLPYINQWWDVMADTLRATLLTLIQDLPPSLPLLLLATSEQPYQSLDPVLQSLFNKYCGEVASLKNPSAEERHLFFKDLLLNQSNRPPPQKKQADLLKMIAECKNSSGWFSRSKRGRRRKSGRRIVLSKKRSGCKRERDIEMAFREISGNEIENKPPPVKSTSQPLVCKPQIMPTHHMKLRPRVVSKLNRNQSAKNNTTMLSSIITQSRHPASSWSYNSKNGFVRPEAAISSFHAEGHNRPCSAKSWLKLGQKLSSRHERYIRRLKRLEKKMAQNSSSSNVSAKEKSGKQESFSSLSARHVRYIRRLQRIDAALENVKSHCVIRHPTSKSNSVFSCGSFQMLYKRDDRYGRPNCTKDSCVLPINFKALNISKHFKTSFERNEIARTSSEVIHQHPRYNLRLLPRKKRRVQRILEEVPKAAPPKPRELTEEELQQLVEKEDLTLMELRIFLRDVLNKLGSDRKFSIFAKPVDSEDAPDYYDVIAHPMDLSTMMSKIDLHEYMTVRAFMDDVDLICSNALEYNPNRGPMDRIIRHRACALKDTAYAIIKTELDKDFEKTCLEIQDSRKRRGEKSATVPKFYYTLPKNQPNQHAQAGQSSSNAIIPSYLTHPKPVRTIPSKPDGERFSRRVRGLNTDPVPTLDEMKRARSNDATSSSTRQQENDFVHTKEAAESKIKDKNGEESESTARSKRQRSSSLPPTSKSSGSASDKATLHSVTTSSKNKRKPNKCVWCKPKRKRRRLLFQKSVEEIEENDDNDASQDEMETAESNSSAKEVVPSQPLSVDTNHSNILTRSSNSPNVKSLRSPVPQAAGVTTRRRSLSPRVAGPSNEEVNESKQQNDTSEVKPMQSGVEDLKSKLAPQEEPCSQQEVPFNLITSGEDKPRAVKRLDLDMVVDSGHGSSLESNGDSRDGTDHKAGNDVIVQASAVLASKSPDANQNCSTDSAKQIVTDIPRLTALLGTIVAKTDGFTVERLEKIYSYLSLVIHRHRKIWDKTALIRDLEGKVDELTKTTPTIARRH